MNRRKLSHGIAAGLLVGMVAMPGPAGARGVERHVATDVWSRLVAMLWSRTVSNLVPWQKQGLGIDPNGGNSGSGGSSGQSAPMGSTGGFVTSGDEIPTGTP
jgi:hypothetical protein